MSDIYDYVISNLPLGYNYGNDNTVIKDNIPNHKAWKQSLREDHPGDVGLFITDIRDEMINSGLIAYHEVQMQVAIVVINGDISSSERYIRELYNNLINNKIFNDISVSRVDLLNIVPLGKNTVGNQMNSCNLLIDYM